MSMQKFFKTVAVVLGTGTLLFGASDSHAQPPAVPLSITSKSMVAKHLDRMVIFEGNVVLSKGDFTLTANRLEVTLAPENPGNDTTGQTQESFIPVSKGKRAVSLIEAIGNVQVDQGERHGKAERAVYDQKDEKVILTGHPEVWEKDYRVSGKKMIFFLKEQKNVVEDGTAVVYPNPGGDLTFPAQNK
jgi:lipopolysaccharide export system protein LptA